MRDDISIDGHTVREGGSHSCRGGRSGGGCLRGQACGCGRSRRFAPPGRPGAALSAPPPHRGRPAATDTRTAIPHLFPPRRAWRRPERSRPPPIPSRRGTRRPRTRPGPSSARGSRRGARSARRRTPARTRRASAGLGGATGGTRRCRCREVGENARRASGSGRQKQRCTGGRSGCVLGHTAPTAPHATDQTSSKPHTRWGARGSRRRLVLRLFCFLGAAPAVAPAGARVEGRRTARPPEPPPRRRERHARAGERPQQQQAARAAALAPAAAAAAWRPRRRHRPPRRRRLLPLLQGTPVGRAQASIRHWPTARVARCSSATHTPPRCLQHVQVPRRRCCHHVRTLPDWYAHFLGFLIRESWTSLDPAISVLVPPLRGPKPWSGPGMQRCRNLETVSSTSALGFTFSSHRHHLCGAPAKTAAKLRCSRPQHSRCAAAPPRRGEGLRCAAPRRAPSPEFPVGLQARKRPLSVRAG